jgi:small subunit ribosomal protein S7
LPRRSAAQVRPIEPDPVHRSRLVQQVINKVMLDGKKSTAEKIVYDALAIINQRTGKDAVEQLEASIKSLTPVLEVRSRRVGGATYQVPVEVPSRRARTLAVRWLVEFSRKRREKTMAQRLANELLDAQSQQGGAYKRKDDIYRMAQANKAFAHYRWAPASRTR